MFSVVLCIANCNIWKMKILKKADLRFACFYLIKWMCVYVPLFLWKGCQLQKSLTTWELHSDLAHCDNGMEPKTIWTKTQGGLVQIIFQHWKTMLHAYIKMGNMTWISWHRWTPGSLHVNWSRKIWILSSYLRFCSNLIFKRNFSLCFQQTNFFENWLRFHEVADYIKWTLLVISNAE